MTEPSVLIGGCACGAVRYESREPPGFSFHCQCRACQRATGAGHASAFVLPVDAVTLTGKISTYDRPSDRGNTVTQGFCARCGSPVLNRNAAYPDSLYVNAATLDDPTVFHPTTVLFRDKAQPRDAIDL